MEYKEHKKMYKAGKKWAVAALVSASVLAWGMTASADSSTASSVDASQSSSMVAASGHEAAAQSSVASLGSPHQLL